MEKFTCIGCGADEHPGQDGRDKRDLLQATKINCPCCGLEHVWSKKLNRYTLSGAIEPEKPRGSWTPRRHFSAARNVLCQAAVRFALDSNPGTRDRLEQAADRYSAARRATGL